MNSVDYRNDSVWLMQGDCLERMKETPDGSVDLVLDFACGSGTTGVACRNLNRKFIGIEMDKGQLEIVKKRDLGE